MNGEGFWKRTNEKMRDCFDCEYAEFDYEPYYGGYQEKIVTGCRIDRDPAVCEDEEKE